MTALDRYINTPDPDASWKFLGTEKGSGYTTYLLDGEVGLVAQGARSIARIWQHHVLIVVPDNVTPGPAVLLIGRQQQRQPNQQGRRRGRHLARSVGAIAVELRQIPNQPLTFADHDGKPHSKTASSPSAWAQVVKTGDPTWHARFPMVRAAVRAMDATQAFLNSPQGPAGPRQVHRRGRLEARLDDVDDGGRRQARQRHRASIVIDVLNVSKFMRQHVRNYGFWARSLYDHHLKPP